MVRNVENAGDSDRRAGNNDYNRHNIAAVFMGLNNDIFVKMSNCENGKGILFFVE